MKVTLSDDEAEIVRLALLAFAVDRGQTARALAGSSSRDVQTARSAALCQARTADTVYNRLSAPTVQV
jgi:hypothetical protein